MRSASALGGSHSGTIAPLQNVSADIDQKITQIISNSQSGNCEFPKLSDAFFPTLFGVSYREQNATDSNVSSAHRA